MDDDKPDAAADSPTAEKENEKKPEDHLSTITRDLMADVDSARELFDAVLPLLDAQDKQRDERISIISHNLSLKDPSEFAKPSEVKELLDVAQDYVERRGRADRLFRSNSVVSLISRFDEFIARIIEIILSLHPNRLSSSDKKLTYGELVTLSSIEELKARFITEEIDSIMRDSHENQLRYIAQQLKIEDLKKHLGTWPSLLELTERRNVCVHNGGLVSSSPWCK